MEENKLESNLLYILYIYIIYIIKYLYMQTLDE